jgi:hypothetical protein
MKSPQDKSQSDAYKAGVDGFNKVLQDFRDGFAKLNKHEVLVRCAGCKTEKMVSKIAIKESVIRCKCGGFMMPVSK